MGTYNNNATSELNEHNLGALSGYEEGKAGKKLNDLRKGFKSPKYKEGVEEGFEQYLNDIAQDTDNSMHTDTSTDQSAEENGASARRLPEPPEMIPQSDAVEGPSLEGGVKEYTENPTVDSFSKVFNILNAKKIYDSRWLKMAAILYQGRKDKIEDAVEGGTIEYWLNRLLAEEFNAWYQYYIIEKFLIGEERPHIQEAFKEYGDDELNDHANGLLNRLHDLGFEFPYLTSPKSWDDYAAVPFSLSNNDVDSALHNMIQSEKAAIDSYSEAVKFAESVGDVVSRDLFKDHLKDEEEHMAELMHFLKDRA